MQTILKPSNIEIIQIPYHHKTASQTIITHRCATNQRKQIIFATKKPTKCEDTEEKK